MAVLIVTPEQLRAEQAVSGKGRHDGSPPPRDPDAPAPEVPRPMSKKDLRLKQLDEMERQLQERTGGEEPEEDDVVIGVAKTKGPKTLEEAVQGVFALPSSDDLDIPEAIKEERLAAQFRTIDGLPSNYHYYDFKELRVRPFVWVDVRDLGIARANNNMRYLLEVVGRCISVPLRVLTVGDFIYICYWLRLNSYPKSPVVVTWGCRYCEHENLTKIHTRSVKIIELEEKLDLDPRVEIPRMATYLEYMHAVKDQPLELVGLLDVAMWVKADTLAEKLQIMDESPDLDLFETARATKLEVGIHGVADSIEAECGAYGAGGCGEVNRVRLEAPLLNFLSGL